MKGLKRIIVFQYLDRQNLGHRFTGIPLLLDIWSDKYKPVQTNNTIPHVVYSPSEVTTTGWFDKGYAGTKPILAKYTNLGHITTDIITNTAHSECMRRKSLGDIGIDEIKTGLFNLCSLENLSLGLANFANMDEFSKRAVFQSCGSLDFPIISADVNTFEEKLKHLINNPDELKQIKLESRLWMEKHWAPEKLIQHFVDIYKSM